MELDDGSASYAEFMDSQRYDNIVEKSLQKIHFKIEFENSWNVTSDDLLKVEICGQEFPASLLKH